jgi:hypothetical protein
MQFLSAVRATDSTQPAIDKRLLELHPERSREISEIRTAMIGRLNDAQVVRPVGVGPSGSLNCLMQQMSSLPDDPARRCFNGPPPLGRVHERVLKT